MQSIRRMIQIKVEKRAKRERKQRVKNGVEGGGRRREIIRNWHAKEKRISNLHRNMLSLTHKM